MVRSMCFIAVHLTSVSCEDNFTELWAYSLALLWVSVEIKFLLWCEVIRKTNLCFNYN